MGTTVEKADYAFGTKDLLKTEINKINNVLDDNSTFRSYPQELFNGYLDILNNGTDTLWNNLEKVSASGEETTLENVETAPMKMVLNGNTSQDTTNGKNKFSTDYLDTYTYDTYTQLSKNSFEFNATTSWRTSRFKIPCKSNTDYYFNLKQDLSVSTRNVYIVIRGVQTGEIIYELYVGYLKAFNSGENTELMINIQSGGAALSGKIYNIQLEEGTSPTEFEEYTGGQPSPNPDYPQEVKVVKGENVVSVQGKNLLDISYLVEANADKTYAPQGFWAFKLSDKIGTYTLSRENANMVSGGSYIAWGEGNDITTAYNRKTWIAHQSQPTLNNKKQTKTNSGELWLFLSTNETRIQNIPNDYGYLMLEQGSTATDFVPYSKTDYPINLGDIEQCKINTYKDFPFKAINGNEYYDTLTDEQKNALNYGSWYVHKVIGKDVFNGSESWNLANVGINKVKKFYLYTASSYVPMLVKQYSNYAEWALSVYNYGSGNKFQLEPNRNLIVVAPENMTLEQYKEKLNTTPMLVYYVLATPTEEEITNTTLIEQLEAIYKAKSVKDKTYITQTNDDLPFILDVEAIKEYEVN